MKNPRQYQLDFKLETTVRDRMDQDWEPALLPIHLLNCSQRSCMGALPARCCWWEACRWSGQEVDPAANAWGEAWDGCVCLV